MPHTGRSWHIAMRGVFFCASFPHGSEKTVAVLGLEDLAGSECWRSCSILKRNGRPRSGQETVVWQQSGASFPSSPIASRLRRNIAPRYCGCRSKKRQSGRCVTWSPQRFLALLSQPDRRRAEGQRDHALLSFLYNTGARIQEALDLRPQDMHLKSPHHVTLMGKGRKERISPIWPETAELLAALLRRHPRQADEPLFVNRYGEPLTASGFRFRLRQYVKAAAGQTPTLSRKRITPHVFRHSTAVGLLAAGVDVTVIRSWLGHAHLDTTNHYAQASLEMKRKALEQVDGKLRPAKPPRWKRDADLMAWLDSL